MSHPLHLAARLGLCACALLLLLAAPGCRKVKRAGEAVVERVFGGVRKKLGVQPRKSEWQTSYQPPQIPLGVNLGSVNYFATAIPFLDVMRMADPFQSTNAPGSDQVWDTKVADKIPRDADGYPLEAPFNVPGVAAPQVLRASVVSAVYSGRYVLLWDGDGELDVPASLGQVVSRAPGRLEFDARAKRDSSIFVSIVRSNKNDHVRNVRFILPGYEASYAQQIFHPTFLGRLQGVGVLRFMDWGNTNGSEVEHWEQRTTPSMSQGTTRGVALETMIELANRVHADAWFCVPHLADDHYIEEMAKLIKAKLDPKQKAYIEYSNEIWNGIFEQSQWAGRRGCEDGLNDIGAYDGDCDDDGARYWAGIKWQARRSAQIFQIFDKTFAADATRLVRVLAGQAQNEHLSVKLLEAFDDPAVNPLKNHADVLAVAPYAGGSVASKIEEEGQGQRVNISDVLDRIERGLGTEIRESTKGNRLVAESHGLKLVAYEGGQHLVAYGALQNDEMFVGKLIEANRHARMRAIYAQLLDDWYKESNGGLMVLFNYIESPNKFGVWGLLESQEQPLDTAPKYQAFFDRLQRFRARSASSTSAAAPPPTAAPAQPPPSAAPAQPPPPAATTPSAAPRATSN